jgi:hypothetical protein
VSNVVSLSGEPHPAVGEPREGLVSLLEDMIVKARSGELQSFIGAGFTSDGGRISLWYEGEPHVYKMLGSLAWLQHE